MQHILRIIGGIVVLALLVIGGLSVYKSNGGSVGSLTVSDYYSLGTNTNATINSVTASVILATSTARGYAAIVNSSTTDAYLGFGQTAVAGSGYYLKASGGTYVIDSSNLFVGALSAITSSGTTTLTIVYDR